MAPPGAGARIVRGRVGRKYVLPSCFEWSARIFLFQRVRQLDSTVPAGHRLRMPFAHVTQVQTQRWHQRFRQDRDAILAALAITYYDHPALQIDILDAQSKRLQHAQSTSVKE